MNYVYVKDQELPSLSFNWTDRTNTTIDFSTGWTFTAKLAAASLPATILFTKTSGITGAATSPNIVVDWATTDFSTLPADIYVVWLYARRTSDTKDRVFSPGNLPKFVLVTAPA